MRYYDVLYNWRQRRWRLKPGGTGGPRSLPSADQFAAWLVPASADLGNGVSGEHRALRRHRGASTPSPPAAAAPNSTTAPAPAKWVANKTRSQPSKSLLVADCIAIALPSDSTARPESRRGLAQRSTSAAWT